jgi:hypothetical protein
MASFRVRSDKISPVIISTRTTVPVVSNPNSLTQTGVSIDEHNNMTGINNITILGQASIVLINEDVSITPVGPKGALAYDIITNKVYVSNGVSWVLVGAVSGTIIGPVSIVNRLTKVSGLDTITESGISVDGANNVTGINDLSTLGHSILAIVNANVSLYPVGVSGSLVYDTVSSQLFLSNGVAWNPIASTPLPPALISIANLITSGNEMIYTIASNTYATSPITAAGRSFLSESTVLQQQTALGLVIGTNVQAHSTSLDSINTIAAGPANQIIYTTGPGLSNTTLSSYVRTNILPATSAAAINTTLNSVAGASSLSIVNAVTKVSGAGSITQSGVSIDGSNNVTGVLALTATGLTTTNTMSVIAGMTVGGNIDSITPAERTQLANIGVTTISPSSWGFVGSLNQNVSSTATPTFIGLAASAAKITNVLDPTNPQDAATKKYVDTVAATGAPPLAAVKYATAAILPNAPTYSSITQTLTSTAGAGVALVIDGYTTLVTDNGVRILVKDQADNRQNGVYTITDYGGGASPWQITRATDFNQAAMPKTAGTSVFVQIVPGLSNSASTWALETSVNNINPLTDAVIWIQIGGVPTYTAGQGINVAALSGGTITTDISARLKYTGNLLDINTIPTTYGGTGIALLAGNTNKVLVTDLTNGTNPLNILKSAPAGDFVGTTDTQVLTNKTITDPTNTVRATQLATTGADVVLTAGVPPSVGQVLTATSAIAAQWAAIPPTIYPSRTLFVYQGATNVSPNYSTLVAAISAATALVPTTSNWVKIEVFSGTYSEIIPISVPQFVSITGLTSSQGDVIIRPVAPAAASPVFILSGNARLSGMIISGADGVGGNATHGILSSVGVVGAIDLVNSVSVKDCTTTGIKAQGNGAQYSKLLYLTNIFCLVTQVGLTMNAGFECRQGAVMAGNNLITNGFFVSGFAGIITYGFITGDNYSVMDVNMIQATQVANGAYVGGSTSASQGVYPIFRCSRADFGRISTIGAIIDAKSVVKISNFSIEDDTGIYPNQIHVSIINPSLPNDPNYISAAYSNLRNDLFVISGALNNPPTFSGVNLSEVPGNTANLFLNQVNVGFRVNPSGFTTGGGDHDPLGMTLLTFDSGVYTDVTSQGNLKQINPVSTDLATTAQINLASAPATIDGVVPTSGVTRVLVKDGSTVNPNVSGYSIDNGVYIWNGTGNPMTRSADLIVGTIITAETWFAVVGGATNYGSRFTVFGKNGAFGTNIITIGTSTLLFDLGSFSPFVSNTNGDALYIGSTTVLAQFVSIEIGVTFPISTNISFTASSTIAWEYWNGASWITLPLMSIANVEPFANNGTQTFAYGDTIISPAVGVYEYRFGSISSSWGTTTVNGILGYWIRARIVDAANILVLPIIETILLGSSTFEAKYDGYVELYGVARPTNKVTIPLTTLSGTGTAGEVAPIAIRLMGSTSPNTIAGIYYNSVFANGVQTSAIFSWDPPTEIDTSMPLTLYILFTHPAGVSNNATWQVDYVVVTDGSIVTVSGGSPSSIGKNTSVNTLVTSTAGQVQRASLTMDITGLIATTSTMLFKLSRFGNTDAYAQSVYVTNITLEYTKWSIGGFKV